MESSKVQVISNLNQLMKIMLVSLIMVNSMEKDNILIKIKIFSMVVI